MVGGRAVFGHSCTVHRVNIFVRPTGLVLTVRENWLHRNTKVILLSYGDANIRRIDL